MTDEATTDHVAASAAPPAGTAAGPGRPAPPPLSCDPLVSMLTFLQAISGNFRLKIDDQNAPAILAEMRREHPGITRPDIVFGAQVAASIASQMRSLEWRMRNARGAPIAERKKKRALAGPVIDADGGGLYRAGAEPVQGFLEGLDSPPF